MTTEESITATVTMSDSDSGVNVTGSKWVLSTSSGYIGTEDGSYTNSFTTNPEEIKLTATTAGEYYVHILAKDNAGNTIEFVSSKITVEEVAKSEVEEAIKDGNVFEEKTEITDELGTNGYKSASKETNSYYKNDTISSYDIGSLYNAISQMNASKVAINTYNDSNSVKSDLMNSYVWDTALVFIQEAGNTDYANKEFSIGNVSNTGKNGDEVCKINDMGANLEEWTTETNYDPSGHGMYVCTTRGRGTPATRGETYTTDFDGLWDNYSAYGFRITLYIK